MEQSAIQKRKTRRRKLLALLAIAAACANSEIEGSKRNRRFWVRPFLLPRKKKGDFYLAVRNIWYI
jgi:hypothetical protein